jgi:hypothetical protein
MTSKGWFKVSAQALQAVPAEFQDFSIRENFPRTRIPGRHSSETAQVLVVIPAI